MLEISWPSCNRRPESLSTREAPAVVTREPGCRPASAPAGRRTLRVLPPSHLCIPLALSRRPHHRAQHGGLTVLDNLALSCLHCNRHKGPNIAGTDPRTGEVVRLFHPRNDQWSVHFEW